MSSLHHKWHLLITSIPSHVATCWTNVWSNHRLGSIWMVSAYFGPASKLKAVLIYRISPSFLLLSKVTIIWRCEILHFKEWYWQTCSFSLYTVLENTEISETLYSFYFLNKWLNSIGWLYWVLRMKMITLEFILAFCVAVIVMFHNLSNISRIWDLCWSWHLPTLTHPLFRCKLNLNCLCCLSFIHILRLLGSGSPLLPTSMTMFVFASLHHNSTLLKCHKPCQRGTKCKTLAWLGIEHTHAQPYSPPGFGRWGGWHKVVGLVIQDMT